MDHQHSKGFFFFSFYSAQEPLNYNLSGLHFLSSAKQLMFTAVTHLRACGRAAPAWLLLHAFPWHNHHLGFSFHSFNRRRWLLTKIVFPWLFLELMLRTLLYVLLHWPPFDGEGHSSKQRSARPEEEAGQPPFRHPELVNWFSNFFASLLGLSQAFLLI